MAAFLLFVEDRLALSAMTNVVCNFLQVFMDVTGQTAELMVLPGK
jgi:hypothetical protein